MFRNVIQSFHHLQNLDFCNNFGLLCKISDNVVCVLRHWVDFISSFTWLYEINGWCSIFQYACFLYFICRFRVYNCWPEAVYTVIQGWNVLSRENRPHPVYFISLSNVYKLYRANANTYKNTGLLVPTNINTYLQLTNWFA